MPSITIRNVDDDLKARLRLRAARNGCSLSDEALSILRQHVGLTQALAPAPAADASYSLAHRIHARFAADYRVHGEGELQLINPWQP
jgi:plasmid stability protein